MASPPPKTTSAIIDNCAHNLSVDRAAGYPPPPFPNKQQQSVLWKQVGPKQSFMFESLLLKQASRFFEGNEGLSFVNTTSSIAGFAIAEQGTCQAPNVLGPPQLKGLGLWGQ